MSGLQSAAEGKLLRVLGPEQGRAVVDETLKQLGLSAMDTPQDCLRFGEALIRRGGLLEVVGRAIKIQALLHGAHEA